MPEQPSLNLEQLSALTGAKPRTIATYVQSGLLDPPDGETLYSQRHLQRLRDVLAWESEGLTQEAIRQRLKGFRNPWFTQNA